MRHDGRRDRTFRNLPTALAGLLKSFVVADVVVEGILIMVGRLLEGPPRSAEGREEVMVLERVSLVQFGQPFCLPLTCVAGKDILHLRSTNS